MANRKTVLLVDDDTIQTAILKAYFIASGAENILEAASAGRALQILKGAGPAIQLLVTDLKMDGMDGIELLRAAKEHGFDGEVAIISSMNYKLIKTVERLAALHGLNIIGSGKKPVTKQTLDGIFLLDTPKPSSARQTPAYNLTEAMINQALSEKNFVPFYQPKVDIATKTIVGAEALARLHHPEFGILTPNQFMPIIEALGQSPQLTQSTLHHVFQDLNRWVAEGADLKIAFNIEASELDDVELPGLLSAQLAEHHIDAKRLVMEVTENSVLDLNTVSLEVLTRLCLMGMEIAIDDFGTGFSNINALRQFPYDELKIDRSFIDNITADPFSQESVRASLALGRQLGMRVLAEGIETLEQWRYLQYLGVDHVQGYLITKPLSAADFIAFYRQGGGRIYLDDSVPPPDAPAISA